MIETESDQGTTLFRHLWRSRGANTHHSPHPARSPYEWWRLASSRSRRLSRSSFRSLAASRRLSMTSARRMAAFLTLLLEDWAGTGDALAEADIPFDGSDGAGTLRGSSPLLGRDAPSKEGRRSLLRCALRCGDGGAGGGGAMEEPRDEAMERAASVAAASWSAGSPPGAPATIRGEDGRCQRGLEPRRRSPAGLTGGGEPDANRSSLLPAPREARSTGRSALGSWERTAARGSRWSEMGTRPGVRRLS